LDEVEMKTYPFSDPDPVPAIGTERYPYFRYDGSTDEACTQAWKVVTLENENIRLAITPEIGGKIWGATDKRTGTDFIYWNHVAKFRDIAMRGPWCSGGIEYNFGIIGHAPSSSTPVDWFVRTNADCSVSFFAASAEYITRAWWQVEVRLRPGADSFETHVTWANLSGLVQPYYHWMNAAFPLWGNPRFLFPGTRYAGHEGDVHAWPRDAAGHELDVYRGNAFGGPKSYHVLPGDNGHYAIWWPERGIGAVHESNGWEKYGRKIWLWALSREGGIWEDLLTDSDGQYTELQSGRYFIQPRWGNYATALKYPAFSPGSTERFSETWGVLRRMEDFAEGNEAAPAARPEAAPVDFDWASAYGEYVRGRQHILERHDAEAEACFRRSLAKDRFFVPSMVALAAVEMRRGGYAVCHDWASRALAIDTTDEGANYLDGFAAFAEGDMRTARDRLGLAAFGTRYRSAAYALIARSFLRERQTGEAFVAAEKALDANDANFDALQAKLIALRGTPAGCEFAAEILTRYPLWHAARYELEGEKFRRYVTNELASETYRELGCWYRETGLAEDADKFFAWAEETPGRLPPFRREQFADARGFDRAVLFASFNQLDKASEILEAAGDAPTDPVFYMTRARTRTGARRLADLRRAAAVGDSWRVGRDLCAYYAEAGDWAILLEVAADYVKRYPAKNPIQIAYANALVRNGRFREAMDYLSGVKILPSEHRDNATGIWHEAQKALGLPLTYPENLGTGAPFPKEQVE
jgi:tetratricopeptide (TPR) repeat protein